MPSTEHWAIVIDNTSDRRKLINALMKGELAAELKYLKNRTGALFSPLALEEYLEKEDRHGTKVLTKDTGQSLKSMSSGERKKALLRHISTQNLDFIILDNPFDNLDTDTQEHLQKQLVKMSERTSIVQLLSRRADKLPFIHRTALLEDGHLIVGKKRQLASVGKIERSAAAEVPPPIQPTRIKADILVQLKSVKVTYGNKTILNNIDWTVRKGKFWELRGKNGSGKTTILSMITGENPKGYGQDLYIFGRKKGSGESIWDIKKNIGYFTPSMTDQFTGYHSAESMIISGFNDSIGLYIKPTEIQLRLAKKWLQLIGLEHQKDQQFHKLPEGQKRLVMCARAMVKHPPLLILDEPTAGLDDASATLFVNLVNAFTRESETAVIFVSHRKEPGLDPDLIYGLQMTPTGSLGRILDAKNPTN